MFMVIDLLLNGALSLLASLFLSMLIILRLFDLSITSSLWRIRSEKIEDEEKFIDEEDEDEDEEVEEEDTDALPLFSVRVAAVAL